ncbi:hypothetical protein P389DRAFT_188739 [Cystobasidium minutum MCA 4210]|uniref:uncharacterized protein n=1 Tax=Cystobasidium minutum MCA 4210 TaxID=1397322 RepID=UPI0034CD4764|eukprot:jgi/Rhomi1/188739/estExt_fgenesh1_pg.C_3_t10132
MTRHPTWLAALMLLTSAFGLAHAADPTYWDITKFKKQSCPAGSTWIEWQDGFYPGGASRGGGGGNPYEKWTAERGASLTKYDGLAMNMNLTEGKDTNDTALASASSWLPPVYAQMDIESTGAPGIPSTFNFRKDNAKDGEEEIDFIIASREDKKTGKLRHFVSTPIYLQNDKKVCTKAKILGPENQVWVHLPAGVALETNSTGTFESLDGVDAAAVYEENWAITWDGFEPAKDFNTYAIKWLDDSIEWWAGPKSEAQFRVRISKVTRGTDKDNFPKGPLPMRVGPWEAGGDWAGVVDWAKYPLPRMRAGKIKVHGCRLNVTEWDKEMGNKSS